MESSPGTSIPFAAASAERSEHDRRSEFWRGYFQRGYHMASPSAKRDYLRERVAQQTYAEVKAESARAGVVSRDEREYSLYVEERGDAAYPTIEEWREAV